jgi:hypothetical protein
MKDRYKFFTSYSAEGLEGKMNNFAAEGYEVVRIRTFGKDNTYFSCQMELPEKQWKPDPTKDSHSAFDKD